MRDNEQTGESTLSVTYLYRLTPADAGLKRSFSLSQTVVLA